MNDALSGVLGSDAVQSAAEAQSSLTKFVNSLSLTRILTAVVLLLVCAALIRLVQSAAKRLLARSHIETRLHKLILAVTRGVMIFIAVMLLAGTLGVDTSSLLAILSVAGLAISLSVQDLLANIAAAVLLLTSKPFRVGDYVEIDGRGGTVELIGLFHTRLLCYDGQILYLPNSKVTASRICNCTGGGKRRVDLTVTVSYDADPQVVCAALRRAAEVKDVLPGEPVYARVEDYRDSAVAYALRVWTTPAHYYDVRADLLDSVWREFRAAGVEMTYPHLVVHTPHEAIKQ